jgi:chromosome segregation ATPase
VVLGLVAASADAQTARSGGGASAQLLQQMQQLASERTGLQAEIATLKKDLEQVRAERDKLKAAQQAVERRAQASQAALAQSGEQREAAARELQQTKDRTQELIGKFRETIQTLRQTETESAETKRNLSAREQELKVCVDHNEELLKMNGEILTRLESRSWWSRAASAEPFTRIGRVRLENLADEYRQRADDQRFKPQLPPAPPTGTSIAPAAPIAEPGDSPPTPRPKNP